MIFLLALEVNEDFSAILTGGISEAPGGIWKLGLGFAVTLITCWLEFWTIPWLDSLIDFSFVGLRLSPSLWLHKQKDLNQLSKLKSCANWIIYNLNVTKWYVTKSYPDWNCLCFSVGIILVLLASNPMLLNFWMSVFVGLSFLLGWCKEWSLMFWNVFPEELQVDAVTSLPTPEEQSRMSSSLGVHAWDDWPEEQLSLKIKN